MTQGTAAGSKGARFSRTHWQENPVIRSVAGTFLKLELEGQEEESGGFAVRQIAGPFPPHSSGSFYPPCRGTVLIRKVDTFLRPSIFPLLRSTGGRNVPINTRFRRLAQGGIWGIEAAAGVFIPSPVSLGPLHSAAQSEAVAAIDFYLISWS